MTTPYRRKRLTRTERGRSVGRAPVPYARVAAAAVDTTWGRCRSASAAANVALSIMGKESTLYMYIYIHIPYILQNLQYAVQIIVLNPAAGVDVRSKILKRVSCTRGFFQKDFRAPQIFFS